MTWHGEAGVYDGWLRGISGIYRSDNAEFVHDSDGRVVGMSAGMGIGGMKVGSVGGEGVCCVPSLSWYFDSYLNSFIIFCYTHTHTQTF